MKNLVLVHGVGWQRRSEAALLAEWGPALSEGLALAGVAIAPEAIAGAFYGDLFRTPGTLAGRDPRRSLGNLSADLQQLVLALWREAARIDPRVLPPGAETLVRAPQPIQRALAALSRSPYFARLTASAMIFDLEHLLRYLGEPRIRQQAQDRIAARIGPETTVLVGHSLGSVVAYEALCANPQWPVTTLVTLGSPLGIDTLIFQRLRPAPRDGVGQWPAGLQRWSNIADPGDLVALEKRLSLRFGPRVRDLQIHNGAHAHDAVPYLRSLTTGRAIAEGL